MPRLAGAAAEHTRELLVMSFPRQSWWMAAGLWIANLIFLVTRREFHVFLHPPRRIVATSESKGLREVLDQQGLLWTVAALRRPTAA
jgi:hypothetical protein